MTVPLVLWVYVGLLLVGGLIGFIKAKSRVSLIMSAIFAAALAACAARLVAGRVVPGALLGALLVVFLIRVIKTRKFMPAGLMLVLTGVTLTVICCLKD